MGLKVDPCFQVTLRRGDKVSPGGGGSEEQPKEKVGTKDQEEEGGVCPSLVTSGQLFPAVDPLLSFLP